MIKNFYIATLLFMLTQSSFGQKKTTFQDSIATYFDEIKIEAHNHQQLW
jgi:hypothetical protein